MKKIATANPEDQFEQILYTLESMSSEELKEFENLYKKRFGITERFSKEYLDELSA